MTRIIKLHASRKPVSISFNVMSLVSSLPVDGNGVDLFTMQSAKYEQITTKFTLSVKGAETGPGVMPVDKSTFRLKTGLHQATLSLARSVQGPQVSHINISSHHNNHASLNRT